MRDPTEFRERFAAYKEGKMPYENGLPKYARGKRGHIGGTTKLARETVWNTDSVLSNAVDSIANAYGLHDGALRHRLDLEGFTDRVINLYNAASDQSQYIGENLLNNKYDFSGIGHFGLDDAATMIGNGQMQLKGETWWDEDGENEKGRVTKGAVGDTVRDTIGLLAAALKHFSDEVKKDFPNLSSYDNARYAQAYYQRGAAGGKKWANNGAKGYNFATKPLAMRPADNPYKITTNILNTASPKFGSYKNGKLPGFEDGKLPRYAGGKPKGDGLRYLWDDLIQSWTRYTGDTMGDVFADFVVTPRGGAHKKDIEPVLIVTPEQQQYSQRNKPAVSTNSTWHPTPAASTFAGRVVQAAGGDWKSADIASAGASLHPLLSVPFGIMDTGYNLNQSLHDLTDTNKHVNTALSAASILPLVGGIKLLKGKDVGTKLLNAYNNYMYSLGNVDDINNTLRNIKYLDSAADATPAVKGVYQDYSFKGRNLFEEMQKRYAREELAGIFKPIDLHDIAKDAYVKDMGRMGILEGKKYDNYNSVVQNVLENSIYPRMQAMRQWIPKEKFLKMFNTIADGRWTMHPVDTFKKAFGKNTTVNGLYTPSTGNIAVRAGGGGDDISDILLHEIRHKIDDGIPLTEEETNILRAAYGDKFMEIPKVSPDWDDTGIGADYDMWPEAVTTNRDARSAALGPMERRMNVHQLNLVIDKLSDQQILEAVANANGYGRRFVDNLIGDGPLDASLVSKEQIKAWREAMKKVGMTTGFGFLGASAIKPRKKK